MKRKLQMALLAGLLVVPSTAIGAGEPFRKFDVSRQSFTAFQTPSNTFATVSSTDTVSFNINDVRLNELYKLNEYTVFVNPDDYRETLTKIGFSNTEPEKTIYDLLHNKITYIEGINNLRKTAVLLNNDLMLLKSTNADAIATVESYLVRYNQLVNDYKTARMKLDTLVKAVTPSADINAVLEKGFTHLSIYTGTFEDFIKTVIPKYETLLTFESAIVKPKKLLESSVANPYIVSLKADQTSTTGDSATTSGDTVKLTFKEFSTTTSFSSDPAVAAVEMAQFRKQNEAITLFMATQMTADERKVFESHKLPSGRAVAELLKEIATNISEADKVTKIIEDTDKLTFKTGASYISQMKKITTAYDKLSPIGKALTPQYDSKVAKKEVGSFNVGYLASEEVVSSIAALKPTSTTEYRNALTKAIELEAKLDPAFKKYVVNNASLVTMEQDLTKVVAVETLINAIATAPTVAKITNARTAYNSLSSAQRKVLLQDIYKDLQKWEKDAKESTKVNTTISKLKIENKKTFATNIQKAQKSYDALTPLNKKMVELEPRLKLMTPLSKIVGQYYGLKLSSKPEYREGIEAVNNALANKKTALTTLTPTATYATATADTIALEKVYDALTSLVTPKLTEINNAKAVETSIDTANVLGTTPDKLKNILAARTSYEALSKNEKKIVNNVKLLKTLESNVKTPSKALTSILAVNPLASNFESKAKSAIKAYDKLTTTQKKYFEEDIAKQVADYKLMVEFIAQMKALKIKNPSYRDDVLAAKNRATDIKNTFSSTKSADLKDAVTKYEQQLENNNQGIFNADKVVALINSLSSKNGEAFLNGVTEIESEYAKLSANDKKLVSNYKSFLTLKKDATTALKVVNLINNSYITNNDVANSGYEKAMKAAITAYDKLTPSQRVHVFNYDSRIKPNLKIYDLVVIINKLNPTSKTYWEDVNSARRLYDAFSPREKTTALPLLSKIELAENGLVEVQNVMKLIDLAVPGTENYVENLQAARAAYDRLAMLNSAFQKLVLNYKLLQEREKAIAPITSAIYEIKELEILISRPFNDATNFVKKYQAAMKAYEKIPFESRQLVTNRDVLVNVIYPVASTMEAIFNIKENSATFGADVAKARQMYDALSASDKNLVTNYDTLVSFETVVSGGSKVDELIRAIPTYSGQNYMNAIKEARAAYDQLSTSEKRAVVLYKQLQTYEKTVQNVMTAIDLIDAMQFSSNLVTAYDKATKALEKLTAEQRQMVSNIQKLTAVAPAIEVYKMIANLKPGSESYIGSVQAAYAAFNRLTSTEKQYVTNFAQLQESKNNIDNLNAVIAKISEIEPGSRNYAKQVQEALALYNALPASVKKLVTNFDILKEANSELDAVEKVRSLISEIDNNAPSFATKVIAARTAYDKLSTSQKRLVSNYFMLEEYERELGTLF